MGCMKSKQTFPFPTTFETEVRHDSEDTFISVRHEREDTFMSVRHEREETFVSEEGYLPRMSSPVTVPEKVKKPVGPNTVVTEYADRLSKEIVNYALQQWACNNIKYHDIPYIEHEDADTVG